MDKTPEQRVWLAGRDTGVEMGRRILAGGAVTLTDGGPDPRVTPELRAAWLNGYGYGISEAAGAIPGHRLALVVQDSTPGRTRLELLPDH